MYLAKPARPCREYSKDPYYYGLVAVTWIGALGALVGLWALTPWFPWN